MEFVPLLEPDVALRQAKLGIWFSTGNMYDFNMAYWMWKRDYRGRYSERYLERSGFDPTTPGDSAEIDAEELLAYIQTKDSAANSIKFFSVALPDADILGRVWLQNHGYDWRNHDNLLVYNNVVYNTYSARMRNNSDYVTLTFQRIIEGQDTLTWTLDIPNEYQGVTCLNVKYGLTGEIPEFYKAYIENIASLPWEDFGVIQDIVMSAIVPIKEDEVFTRETLELKRILNKFGLGGGELIDSLTEDEDGNPSAVDNAYIMEGLPFDVWKDENASDEVKNSIAMALYQSFEYLSTGLNNTFAMSTLSMAYNYEMEIEHYAGVYEGMEQGTYLAMVEGEEIGDDPYYVEEGGTIAEQIGSIGGAESAVYHIYYQISSVGYRRMVITNYAQTFRISGVDFTAYVNSSREEGRLLIPLEVLNDLKFRDFVAVHERSFSLLVYSTETYTIKWYQQSIFRFIITIIVTWFSLGTATAIIDVIVQAAINMAVAYAIGLVVGMIDNEFLALVVTIALVLLANDFGSFDLDVLTVENYLPLANKIINQSSTIYGDYVEGQMVKLQEEAERNKEQQEAWDAEMAGSGMTVTRAMMDAHYSYIDSHGPSAWVNQMLGDSLFNFDQYFSVTNEIEIRKQVTAG